VPRGSTEVPADGLVDGKLLGATDCVGVPVLVEGADERLGRPEGGRIGKSDGESEGNGLGIRDGAIEGDRLGTAEGVPLGTAVGVSVDSGIKTGVGPTDGLVVGT
jgi:hypothetical protein